MTPLLPQRQKQCLQGWWVSASLCLCVWSNQSFYYTGTPVISQRGFSALQRNLVYRKTHFSLTKKTPSPDFEIQQGAVKQGFTVSNKNFTSHHLVASFLATSFLTALPYFESSMSPRKTRTVPPHWRWDMGWPNHAMEHRIVKNLRVVVKMEQVSGPNVVTVLKMNIWKHCNSQ